MKSYLLLLECILLRCLTEAATLTSTCSRTCEKFEQCFVYKDSEYCAPLCAPGRCDDEKETCILRGVAPCVSEPCLPEAVCEPRQTSIINADNPTTASACKLNCQLVSSPVCGSDGVSYANSCFLKEARCTTPDPDLSVRSRGLCDADKELNAMYNPPPTPSSSSMNETCFAAIVCSDVLDPVCTTAGTMQNLCYFNREKRCNQVQTTLIMIRAGACEDSNVMPLCPPTCTETYSPVCASNGQLYGNECLFRQARCARQDLLAVNIERRVLSECQE